MHSHVFTCWEGSIGCASSGCTVPRFKQLRDQSHTAPQAIATVSWADMSPHSVSCMSNILCTLQVFEDTSLSAVYSATNQPTPQQLQAMQPLLEAASAATGSSVQLPRIQHGAGFDKYKDLAPGEAAHEAGYGKPCAACADGSAGTLSAIHHAHHT